MWARNLGLLILRLGCGIPLAMFYGVKKLPPSADFVKYVGSLGFPYAIYLAWAAVAAEFLGSILVILGLGTRFAAASIAITMSVAFFIANADQPLQGRETSLMYLVMSLALILLGGGDWGIERYVSIGKKKGSR